jgi:hypothetical protein
MIRKDPSHMNAEQRSALHLAGTVTVDGYADGTASTHVVTQ